MWIYKANLNRGTGISSSSLWGGGDTYWAGIATSGATACLPSFTGPALVGACVYTSLLFDAQSDTRSVLGVKVALSCLLPRDPFSLVQIGRLLSSEASSFQV